MADDPVLCKNHSPRLPPLVPATYRLEVPGRLHADHPAVWCTYLCDDCLPAAERDWTMKGYKVLKVKL